MSDRKPPTGIASRDTSRRNFVVLVIGLLALVVLAGLLSSCAPVGRSLHRASALTLGFVWPDRATPALRSSFAAPKPPKAVIVQWNPKAYTHAEIAQIAGQQCLTFDRRAKPASRATQGGTDKTQRFDCVVMVGKAGGAARG